MLQKVSPSMLRQEWLHEAEMALRKRFEAKGYGGKVGIPPEVRTSMGFPKGTRDGKLAIGQCWALESSTDKHNEIFISPELGHSGKPTIEDSIRIMGVMAHEYAHTVAGNKAGHRIRKRPDVESGPKYEKWRMSFPAVAEAVGLVAPWTATEESEDFKEWAKGVIDKIGKFPAGALGSFERKKDGTRQRKCTCESCGYIARTSKKWIEQAGPPICPTDKTMMVCEELDEDDDE